MLSTSVRGLCFRLMFRLQGHSKPKEFLNKPLIKKKKKEEGKKGKSMEEKKRARYLQEPRKVYEIKLEARPGRNSRLT